MGGKSKNQKAAEQRRAVEAAEEARKPKECRYSGCKSAPAVFADVKEPDGVMRIWAFCGQHAALTRKEAEPNVYAQAREDFNVFAEQVCRDDESGEPISQAPLHKRWAQLADEHDRLIIWSHVEAGKCEAAGSRVLLASGEWADIESLSGKSVPVQVMDPATMTFRVANASFTENGHKPTRRIRTRTGRILNVTENHPLFLPRGWRRSDSVRVGDFLACARRVPESNAKGLTDECAEIAGYLIGDGGLTIRSRVNFTNIDSGILHRLRDLCSKQEWSLTKKGEGITYAITRPLNGKNGWDDAESPYAWAAGLGIACLSKKKRVPSAIFCSSNTAIAAFLGAYWACDGSVSNKDVTVSSASRGLLEDVQLLLLRFGMRASLNYKKATCNGKTFDSWRLSLTGTEAREFARRIKIYGDKGAKAEALAQAVHTKVKASNDGVPSEWRELHPAFARTDFHTFKILERARKHHRAHVQAYLKIKPDPIVSLMASDAVLWDEVVSIESSEAMTYAVSVDDPAHCYLSSGFLSHNTVQLSILRTVWELGRNPRLRFVILSDVTSQSTKIVRSIATYIEENEIVKQIFPNLARDPKGTWTTTELQVKRPNNAKDPSVRAAGVHTNITGGRIDRLIIDDILGRDNTNSPANRAALKDWVVKVAFSRLTKSAKVLIVGNAWHPEDLLHDLAGTGQYRWYRFPLLDREGGVTWPDGWSAERIDKKRRDVPPEEFARSMLCQVRDDASARFKKADIDKAVARGRALSLISSIDVMPEGCATFTGVDLAMSKKKKSDDTVFFTFMEDAKGNRTVLNIEIGKFSGTEIVSRIVSHHERYRSTIAVESNAAQAFILDFTREISNVPVVPHITTKAKRDQVHGVEGLSIELANGKWIIPSHIATAPQVDRWIREMLFYSPHAHTGDVLMACYFARELARRTLGVKGSGASVSFKALGVGSVASGVEGAASINELMNRCGTGISDEEARERDRRGGARD